MFEISKKCTIAHVNTRRGKQDTSPVAIDIKIKAEDVSAAVAATALRADKTKEVSDAFFKGEEQRFLGIGEIVIDEAWEGKHKLKIMSLPAMRCAKLWKIRVHPRAKGLFDVTFQVTIEEPPQNYIDAIARKINDTAMINLEQDAELDLKRPEAEGEGE